MYKNISMQKILTASEFRSNMAEELDQLTKKKSARIIIKRPKGKGNVVLMSEQEFASLEETRYLLSTEANRKMLDKSIRQAEEGKLKKVKSNDIWK